MPFNTYIYKFPQFWLYYTVLPHNWVNKQQALAFRYIITTEMSSQIFLERNIKNPFSFLTTSTFPKIPSSFLRAEGAPCFF